MGRFLACTMYEPQGAEVAEGDYAALPSLEALSL